MKNILITGKDSYIGDKFAEYLKSDNNYSITIADTIHGEWESMDFSKYDTIFHVAGIAHIKETKDNANLYYKINRDLAIDVAKKAKISGTRQFIFVSSMSIYGMDTGLITRDTKPNPKTHYGKSKLEAENVINELEADNFIVTTLRPPMVFGPGCKGNFPQLIKLAKKTRIFPDYKNKRSMIYIDNLCEFVKQTIDNNSGGMFFPQNAEYFCTSEIVKTIAKHYNRKIWMPRAFNPLIWLGIKLSSTFRKVFGDLVYEQKDSPVCNQIKKVTNKDSICYTLKH